MTKKLNLLLLAAAVIGFAAGCKKTEEVPAMQTTAPAAPAEAAMPAAPAAAAAGAPVAPADAAPAVEQPKK